MRPSHLLLCACVQEIETAGPDTDPDSTFDDSPQHALSPPQLTVVAQPQGPTIDTDLLICVDKAAKELDKSKLTLKKVVKQGFEGELWSKIKPQLMFQV